MLIVYDQEKTIKRMEESTARYLKIKDIRKRTLSINLLTILTTIVHPLYHLIANKPFSTGAFILNSLAIIGVIISTLGTMKNKPSLLSMMPLDAWYHIITTELHLLEAHAERTDKGYSVTLRFEDNEHRTKELVLGDFETQESPDVTTETLDLEKNIVFVPTINKGGAEQKNKRR